MSCSKMVRVEQQFRAAGVRGEERYFMVDYQAWLVQQAGLAKGKTYTENRRRYWLAHIIIMYTWPGLLTSAQVLTWATLTNTPCDKNIHPSSSHVFCHNGIQAFLAG